jgi:2-keto-4-pentenoate hydratase
MQPWEHPLIDKGMRAQLETWRARLAAGEQRLGWKVGLGAPASMQKLGVTAPVVGFVLQSGLLPSGATVSLNDYVRPVVEPEICVRMARDLASGATAQDALAAVASIEPAIEVADLDIVPAPDNLDAVLSGNIFHRHVVLGQQRRAGGGLDGIVSRVTRRGIEFNRTDDPEALTGKLGAIVAHVANTLAAFGDTLRAGEIIITGSITAPVMLEADETEFAHALDPIGEVRVRFAPAAPPPPAPH